MLLNLWSCLHIEKSSEPVLLQPVEDLLEDRAQYSIILNTETDILHCDTETDIFILTDIFCIEEACVCSPEACIVFTLADTVDLQGCCFSLCHIKINIVNYTNSCKRCTLRHLVLVLP